MGLIQKILNSKILERTKRKIALITGIYLKLKRLSPSSSEDYRTVKILETFSFDKIIDIGANTGQFAESLIDFGFKGKILSFEPTKATYEKLQNRALKYDNWEVAERCAVGNYDGEIDINVSKNSLFSSIKDISKEYSSYNSDSSVIHKEKVNIFKLDSLENKYFDKKDNIFLKIDTQGFEKEVLDGANTVLNRINGVKLEIPLKPIYENVTFSLNETIDFFKAKGFKCVSVNEVAVSNKTGIVHEIDGIFIHENILNSKT